MKHASYVLAVCALMPVVLCAQTKLSLESLPQPVQAAVKKELGSLPIHSISQEKDEGKIEYEVETTCNGAPRSYSFDVKGNLLEMEDEVDIASIPVAARATLEKEAAGGSIEEVEKVTSHGAVSYEADVVTRAGKKLEVAVTASGAIQSIENGDEDKD